MPASQPPEGTIALLFTDVEGSTRLARKLGDAWKAVLADHNRLLEDAIDSECGFVDGTEGDAFFATFLDPRAAARATVSALRALERHPWPAEIGEVKVSMGLHVGYVERTAAGYVGLEVHRAARVAAAAHGGQLLLTAAGHELVGDALSVEPPGFHRLKDFPEALQLFCAVVDGRGASAFPPPRTEEVRPTNLAAGTPVLVGREEDVARVREALVVERERVVTLTGRGGIGKTSVALVVAAASLDEYPGGVWLVNLATAAATEELLPAIASAVGAVHGVECPTHQTIVKRVRERGPTLVVLDNMDHLASAASAIGELVDAASELQFLVTSQVPLRIAGELCVALDALDGEVALALIERVARRRTAAFSAGGTDRQALLEVVDLLDGLPLALELAAARLALLSPAQLRDRLRASGDVLRDDRTDRPERQRSLRATLEWTLSLLDPPPRTLFARMGVFAGPVELEDLEAIAGGDGLDVLEALARLIDVAIVSRMEAGDGRVRFGLPQALRQIAADVLDAAPDAVRWRRAHAERALEIVWAARLLGSVPNTAYRAAVALDLEVAAAIRWARASGDPLAEPLAAARGGLLADNGHLREAFAMLEPLLEAPPEDPAIHAHALWDQSWALTAVGRPEEAVTAADKALELAPDPENRIFALSMRSLALSFLSEHDAAIRDGAEATKIARDLHPAMLCTMLMLEGQARLFAGELDHAAELVAEAQSVGQRTDAEFLWRRHTLFGDLAALSGPRDALEHYARSLEEAQIRGNEMQILFDLGGVASSLAVLNDDENALEVAGMAEQQMAELGIPGASPVHLLGQDAHLAARERLEATMAIECEARGRAVPAGQRVTRACQLARARAVPAPRTTVA